MTVRAALAFASGLALALVVAPGVAGATEGETDATAQVGVSVLDARGKGIYAGPALVLMGRHGLSDAFDLALALGASGFGDVGTFMLDVSVGAHYVVDLTRIRPHLGLMLGVADRFTVGCDPRPPPLGGPDVERPPRFACGHELIPVGHVPFGLEWAPAAPFRIGALGRVSLLLRSAEVPEQLVQATFGLSATWVFAGRDRAQK